MSSCHVLWDHPLLVPFTSAMLQSSYRTHPSISSSHLFHRSRLSRSIYWARGENNLSCMLAPSLSYNSPSPQRPYLMRLGLGLLRV